MTTNQTIDGVPRSTLEKALIDAMGSRARHSPHIAELRALLDEPAAPCAIADALESAQWPNTSIGNKVLVAAAITELRKSAQPPARPVAYRWRVKGHGEWTASVCKVEFDARANDDRFVAQALYAEPPAPVAVVLPIRHDFEQFIIRRDGSIWVTVKGDQRSYNDPIERDYAMWLACLDELKRLNPSL